MTAGTAGPGGVKTQVPWAAALTTRRLFDLSYSQGWYHRGMIAMTQQSYTVREAAELLGVGGSRVRQLCIKHNVGTIVKTPVGEYRTLTQKDVDFLRNRKTSPGPEKNHRNVA